MLNKARSGLWRASIVLLSSLGLAIVGLGSTGASANHTTLNRICEPPTCVPNLKYGPAPEHELDAYPGAPGELAPIVVVVFGGGWVDGNRSVPADVAEDLAADGFAVFNIDYRLAIGPPGAAGAVDGVPMQTDDVALAVQWIIDHGADYNADVSHISLFGSSSGAQLAALAGQLINQKPGAAGTIRSVVELSGPMDFVTMVHPDGPGSLNPNINNGMPAYLGCAISRCTDAQLKEPSPLYNISSTNPAYMLVNGDAEIMPVQQATIFQDALVAAGVSSTLNIVTAADGPDAGTKHGLSLWRSNRTTQREIVAFLRTAGTPSPPNGAPTVTTRSPDADATGIAVAANVKATFSEPVTGVSKTTFTLRNAAGTTIPGAVSYNASTQLATLNPTASLSADTRYTVALTGGPNAIRDATGNQLASTSWTFLTGPRPAATTKSPTSGATAVSRTGNVSVTFNEAVAGVNASTFTLTSAAGTVAAVVTRNSTTNRWTLNPNATLAANATYTVTLTGGPTAIRDLAGNPLVTTTWTFRTGA